MILVVLDTNVVVSALLPPLGIRARILVPVIRKAVQLCMTGSIFAECEEVLRRPRFRHDETVIAGALDAIRNKAPWAKSPPEFRGIIRMVTPLQFADAEFTWDLT